MTRKLSIADYVRQVGTWSIKNFDYQDLFGLGIIEELGEFAHAELKYRQRIRGYDTPAKSKEAKLDALADATIFLFNLAHYHKVKLNWPEVEESLKEKYDPNILYQFSLTCQHAAKLMQACVEEDEYTVSSTMKIVFCYLALLAKLLGQDLIKDVFIPVWKEVKKRNWRKYPKNGINE